MFRVTLAVALALYFRFEADAADQLNIRLANEAEMQHDLEQRLQDHDSVAVLCLFTYELGITTYVVKERWIQTDEPQHLRNTFKALETSYKACIDSGTLPNPMLCVIIDSKDRSEIVPVRDGTVQHSMIDGRLGERVALQRYKRLVKIAASRHR